MPTWEEGFLQGHLGEISQLMVLGGGVASAPVPAGRSGEAGVQRGGGCEPFLCGGGEAGDQSGVSQGRMANRFAWPCQTRPGWVWRSAELPFEAKAA